MTGYKRSKKEKSITLLYTNDKWAEKETRKTTLFSLARNNIKHLGLTLPTQGKDLYDKFFKSLKKDAEEGNRRWKGLSCSWIGMINLAKKFSYPKQCTQ